MKAERLRREKAVLHRGKRLIPIHECILNYNIPRKYNGDINIQCMKLSTRVDSLGSGHRILNYFLGGRPLFLGRKYPFTSKMGKTTKVVVYGLKGVGKTAILEQLIYGNINKASELYPTIEDIYVANIETDRGTKEKVRFYDTAGLENPHSASPTARDQSQAARQYMGLVDGYVLVYDTDKPESLDVLVSLKKEIDKIRDKKEVIIVVLGNRAKPMDVGCLENTASKASHWAMREKVKHYEVNAMDRNSLYEPFVHLASRLNPPPNKSTFPQLSMVRKTIGRPESS